MSAAARSVDRLANAERFPAHNWAIRRRGWKPWRERAPGPRRARFNWAIRRSGWKLVGLPRGDRALRASIGPPRRRWKHVIPGQNQLNNFLLQLGHPPEGMEAGESDERQHGRDDLASIGPLPGGDGNSLNVTSARLRSLASIGPPPGGMETCTVEVCSGKLFTCFNWATPRRGWKPPNCGGVQLCSTGFNWATPRRGWKPRTPTPGNGWRTCFNWATPPEGMETRGQRRVPHHQRVVASIGPPPRRGWKLCRSTAPAAAAGEASIGPPPGGMETGGALATDLAAIALQLGHPPEGMETAVVSPRRPSEGGFNWATPRRGWKLAV